MIIPKREQFYILTLALNSLVKKCCTDDPQFVLNVVQTSWKELTIKEQKIIQSLVRGRKATDNGILDIDRDGWNVISALQIGEV